MSRLSLQPSIQHCRWCARFCTVGSWLWGSRLVHLAPYVLNHVCIIIHVLWYQHSCSLAGIGWCVDKWKCRLACCSLFGKVMQWLDLWHYWCFMLQADGFELYCFHDTGRVCRCLFSTALPWIVGHGMSYNVTWDCCMLHDMIASDAAKGISLVHVEPVIGFVGHYWYGHRSAISYDIKIFWWSLYCFLFWMPWITMLPHDLLLMFAHFIVWSLFHQVLCNQ